jgi:hypothetical protein
MKKILLICVLFAASAWAGNPEEAFQRMLSLQGTWEGKFGEETIHLVYEPISSNAALMEKMVFLSDGSSMTTIYHPQGDQLMATHYCKGKNQPRLTSRSDAAAEAFTFQFLDGAKADEMYVSGLELKFVAPQQLEQTVHFAGKPAPIKVLYQRIK